MEILPESTSNNYAVGILIEVEPLDHMKLEDLGLTTCSHDHFPSSREFSSVDEPEPQPLPNLLFLDVNPGGKKGTTHPSTHIVQEFLKKRKKFFTDLGYDVMINPDGIARLYLMRRSLKVLRKFPLDDS
nr:hypothetical protein [Tanacetum cinerariifolium]